MFLFEEGVKIGFFAKIFTPEFTAKVKKIRNKAEWDLPCAKKASKYCLTFTTGKETTLSGHLKSLPK